MSEAILQQLAGSGPLAVVLFGAVYYQSSRVRELEGELRALNERVARILAAIAGVEVPPN